MNMLANGLRWLANKQKAHASVSIEYRHKNQSLNINAWLGQTRIDTTNEAEINITTHVTDVLIRAVDLPFEPALGDEIMMNGCRYEALELSHQEKCWRWSDPFKTVYRIHVRDLGILNR